MDSRDSLSVLTIGNSFTDSLMGYFQPVVESAGCELHFERANHPGCELKRHWSYIESEKADTHRVYRLYQNNTHTMKEILESRPWDVVTMQQASHESWRPETFQPYARNIFDYVREHAPSAEVCIQQTWSYRSDDPRIRPGGEWGIDQTGMYERLTANYRQLAKDLGGLRIIPTGYGVQLARQHQEHSFVAYPESLMSELVWPDMPPQAWALVGCCFWGKDKAGKLVLGRDSIHLNERGRYLQSCIWFGFLYGHPVSEVTYVPPLVADADAAFLREMAQRAVDEFEQCQPKR